MNPVAETLDRLSRLAGERQELNALWEEIAEVLAPERQGFNNHVRARRTDKIFDTTPIIAKRGLVNAIGAMLRPKTASPGKWFDMVPDDEDLLDNREVKAWIDDAEERLWSALYNPRAKFIQATGEVDDDIVSFGTGAVFTGIRNDRKGLIFRSFHMKGTYIANNSDGDVDTVFIEEELTARQAAQRWPEEKLGAKTREYLRDNKDRKCRFVWCVTPRYDRDPRKIDNLNMPWKSQVVDKESEHEVIEEGFEEFPFAVPRWDTRSGSLYGRGPGVLALPDVQTLNQMGKTMLRALHRGVDPTWLFPSDSMVRAPMLAPGKVSYYDASAIKNLGISNPFIQLEHKGNIPWGLDAMSAYREQVFAVFFRNVLNLPIDGPDMTATEVIQRKEEFTREIGAVFGRLESDYTGPMVERAFNTMLREGVFLRPPDVLLDRNINFRFASPIEKAKAQIEAMGIDRGVARILEVGAVKPEVMDWVEWDEWSKYQGKAADFPPEMIASNEKVQAVREQRAQAQQVQAALEMGNQAADAVQKVANVSQKT